MRLIKKKPTISEATYKEETVQEELIVEKAEEEDWSFNFGIYENEEKRTQELQSLKTIKKPRVTGLRSKFSPSMMELESLERIKDSISEYGIKVASQSQDIQDLWKLYGCLDEYWARIHDVFGTIILNEILEVKKECLIRLNKAETKGGIIDYSVHRSLLRLRDRIYIAAQRSNLGLEVEKTTFSHYDKAQKGITE